MQIGKLIKMQMINKGINKQEDLSTLSGVSVQVIGRILSSDDGKLSVAAKLVESLGGEIKVEFKGNE